MVMKSSELRFSSCKSRVKSPAPEAKSSATIEALSPALIWLFSPNFAAFWSLTTFTAIDAPTAVLSPLLPQLPGLSQVTSDATAIAQARLTILLVAVERISISPGALICTFSPVTALWLSSETTRERAPAIPSSPPPAPAIPSDEA